MSKLDPNLLLYKAAQARNLPVMLEALANKADPNWVNQDEEGMTPLMKAVDTVSRLNRGMSVPECLLQNSHDFFLGGGVVCLILLPLIYSNNLLALSIMSKMVEF